MFPNKIPLDCEGHKVEPVWWVHSLRWVQHWEIIVKVEVLPRTISVFPDSAPEKTSQATAANPEGIYRPFLGSSLVVFPLSEDHLGMLCSDQSLDFKSAWLTYCTDGVVTTTRGYFYLLIKSCYFKLVLSFSVICYSSVRDSLGCLYLNPKNRGEGDEEGRMGVKKNSASFHRPESWK